MYSVYRRKGSSFYYCDVRVPDPRGGEPLRVRESTKAGTKAKAQRYAANLEEKLLKRSGADSETSDAVLACLEEAARLHGRQQLTLERARDLLARMTEASSGEGLELHTIRAWFTRWLEGRRAVIKGSTAQQYASHVRLLLEWLGEDADKRLETLTREKLTRFRDALKEGFRTDQSGKLLRRIPRRGRTVDFTIGTISAGLALAAKDGILLANPAAGVEKLGSADSEDREPFTADEVATLFEHAPSPEWAALMSLAFYGGMRLMDGALLRWHSVDLPGKTIRFVPRKTSRKGRELELPMHPELAEALEALPSSDDPDAYALPTLSGKSRMDICDAFAEIMGEAGVSRNAAKEAPGGGRTFYRKGFHSYRHSFASTLAAQDVPPEIRMRLLGHATMTVHQRYTHVELETLRGALEKLS